MSYQAFRTPGVYRRQQPRRSEFPRPRTDVCGFVGVAGTPHLNEPIAVDDWRDYEDAFLRDPFGDLVEPPAGSRLAEAVRAYFANGGARAWVLNVAVEVPETATPLIAATLGLGDAPLDAKGVPHRFWGLERLLRLDQVALVVLPALFATRATETSRVAEDLPPRAEQGVFTACTGIRTPDLSSAAAPLIEQQPLLTDAQVLSTQVMALEACERHIWRHFLVLSPAPHLNPDQVADWRGALSSFGCGALYWPWLLVQEVPGAETVLQDPAPFVAGLMARMDLAKGPHAAPANQALLGVVGLQTTVSDRVQARVYDHGVNPIRHVPGKGLCVWGARTLSFELATTVLLDGGDTPALVSTSQDLLHYVNVRRGLSAIERMAEHIGQRLVFEANTVLTWLQLTQALSSYLTGLFRSGVLAGTDPTEAFFVRCDASVNPPEQIAQGLLVCEIGVALAAPAEFIVFRLGRRQGVTEIQEGT